MKTKIVKEKEQETVLSKKNYIILIIGSILIIAGYIPLPPIIPIYLAKHAYVLPLQSVC